MEKARMTRIVWCIVGLLCLTGAASAMSSAHYGLDWNVIGGGGGAAGSAHYSLNSTIGQVLGQGTSTSYKLTGGFWSILETIPSISSITPNSGPIKEKIPITIRGANFVSGGLFGVKIGGLPATNVVRINATTITAKTPEGTAGAKDVVVTNNDGQTATKVGGFTCVVPPTISIAPPLTYVPPPAAYIAPPTTPVAPPTITIITPNTGPAQGNTPITIRGANFVSGGLFGVKIGGLPATNVVRINATTITAKTPEGTAGAKDVVVTNNDGQTATKVGGFTCVVPPTISIAPPAIPVAVPTISSIMPDSGPTKGNTPITIRGTNFVSGGSFGVKVGGWAATNVTWINATTITAKTPLGSAGARIVVVTNNDGQTATKVGGFTYL
jgi:hypothetical protein